MIQPATPGLIWTRSCGHSFTKMPFHPIQVFADNHSSTASHHHQSNYKKRPKNTSAATKMSSQQHTLNQADHATTTTTSYPPQSSSKWSSRACPGPSALLAPWRPGLLLGSGSPRSAVRSACMWTIFLLRLVASLVMLWVRRTLGTRTGGVVVGVVMLVVSGLLVFWCLAVIGRAEGYRRSCGMRVVSLYSLCLPIFMFLFFCQDHAI